MRVRVGVAKNPNTPEDILRALSKKDGHDNVREAAAQNPNAPEDILRTLSEDENEGVRGAVGQNL